VIRCALAFVLLSSSLSGANDVRCGLYALYVALRAVEIPVASLEELTKRLGPPTKEGYSLGQLQDAAESYGAQTLAVQTNLERLGWRPRPFSVIAHLDGTHFVNLVAFEPGKVRIVDAPETAVVSPEALHRRWSGAALLIAKQPLTAEEQLTNPRRWRQLLWVVGGLLSAIGAVVWLVSRRSRATAVVILALVAPLLIGCGDADVAPARGRLPLPRREVDLGPAPSSKAGVTASIEVENVGRGPLRLIGIVPSCQCLVPSAPPGQLKPGESASFQVVVHPERGGAGEKSVTLLSDDPLEPKAVIGIKWFAVSPISAEPASVAFGELRPGRSATREVSISNHAAECVLGEPQVIPRGVMTAVLQQRDGGWSLRTELTAGSEVGTFQGAIRIPVEGCDAAPLMILASWQVRDVVSAIPARLPLGRAAPGQIVERELRFVSSTGPIRIASLQVESLEAAVVELIPDREPPMVRVRWTAPVTPGIRTGRLIVTCDLPEPVVVAVPLSGIVSGDHEQSWNDTAGPSMP